MIGLFFFLGARGLNEPDEGRFAEASREMSVNSDWLIPRLAGVPHLQKPPMIFWISAASLRIFGVNEWAARLPSALAALGTILLTMHLAGLLFGRDVSWLSGLILLSNAFFFGMARIITTDMLLCFWITAAVVFFVQYTINHQAWALALFYTSLGFGFLTKGPIAYLIPLCAVIPWSIAWRRRSGAANRPAHWGLGLLLSLAIGFSWFIALFRQHPELMTYYLRHEFLDRIASNVHARAKPFWFYSAVTLGGLLPWSLLIPRMVGSMLRLRPLLGSPVRWLFAGWLILPWIVLHAVTSKLPTYVLPLFPPLAIALSWHIIRRLAAPKHTMRWAIIGCLMLALQMILASQADRFLIPLGRTTTDIVASIRAVKRNHPDARIFALKERKYSLDFYLQEPILRLAQTAEKTLPIPEEVRSLYIEDPLQFLRDHRELDIVIVTPMATRTNAYVNDWIPVSTHRKSAVFLRPRVAAKEN